MDTIKMIGIVGSLRKESYNRKLMQAAAELLPEGMELEIAEIVDIPIFNEDLVEVGTPEAVLKLKEKIAGSHAILLATPEYNWSIPGPLKNTIDWVSRPMTTTPLQSKPLALMGATTGPWGTIRAQLNWRQVFAYTNTYVLPQPQVFVNLCESKFDAESKLTDEATRKQVSALLVALADWTRKVGSR